MAVTRRKTPQPASDQPAQAPSALVTTTGRDGNTSEGLDPAVVSRLLAEAGHAGH